MGSKRRRGRRLEEKRHKRSLKSKDSQKKNRILKSKDVQHKKELEQKRKEAFFNEWRKAQGTAPNMVEEKKKDAAEQMEGIQTIPGE